MEQENREWKPKGRTRIQVSDLLEIWTASYYPYDPEGEEALRDAILADHRLAAVAREAAAEAIRELDIIREKRCTCPHDYFHGDHHYQYCPGSDASKAASSQLWMSLNRVAYTLRSLTPPEGETAAGEKGKIQ